MAQYRSLHLAMKALAEMMGEDVLAQRTLEGMLADLLGENFSLQYIIRRAMQTHLGERIVETVNTNGIERLDFVKQTFQEENFLRPEVSDYIVDCFAYAMGALDNVEDFDLAVSDNERDGEPSFVECDDGEFCGFTNQEEERCGFGILRQEDGAYYAGEWRLNMRMGLGLGFSGSREKYAGQWRVNKQNGVGMKLFQNGNVYSGQWRNGRMDGVGTIYFPNGECVCAVFSHGELVETTGSWMMKDGSVVFGTMTKYGPTGACLHVFPDGSQKNETWQKGNYIR